MHKENLTLDSHQHFWRYTEAEFGWIADSALRRDFLPDELQLTLAGAGVDGTIAVEARQTVAETEWLLELARRHPFVKGVVGWVDLCHSDALALQLAALDDPRLCAVRHVVQDEPDDAFILREDFNQGVSAVGERGLAYEILVFQRQLANAIAFVDRHPDMRLVLDHMGKPRPGGEEEWRGLIRDLARRENVWCKVSGLVTEVGKVDFRPYVDAVLDAFGSRRVLWGSDWPVVTADLAYADWVEACRKMLPAECFADNVIDFYRLG